MFEEGSSDQCVYHPGTFMGGVTCMPPHGLAGAGWSCCRRESAHSEGCRITRHHVFCEVTARSLSRFPIDLRDADGGDSPQSSRSRQRKVSSPELSPQPAADYYVVGVGDSLAAIALRHRTTLQTLMRCADCV